VQDWPTRSPGSPPLFDLSRNGLLVSGGDSNRGNRFNDCALALAATARASQIAQRCSR